MYTKNSSLDKNDLEMCVTFVQDNSVPNTHINIFLLFVVVESSTLILSLFHSLNFFRLLKFQKKLVKLISSIYIKLLIMLKSRWNE